MTTRDKGNRTENRTRKVYERAGYAVHRPNPSRYSGSTDIFNLFDIMAVRPDRKPRMVQVKSNRAEGITRWMDSVRCWFPRKHFVFDFVVRYDREGYRLDQPVWSDEPGDYEKVVDERDSDENIGIGLERFLRGH